MNRLPLLLATCALLGSFNAIAHEVPGEKIAVLEEHALAHLPDKKVTLLSVEYQPGQATVPHRHDGAAIAYVLDGEVISQLKGQPPVTYRAGQSWYEPAGTVHLVSKNASASKPATLLVWLLGNEKDPILVPLDK